MNSNDLVQAMDPAGASAVDETALIAALRRGEEWAFEAMVRIYGGRLLAVARRICGNEEDARDALQSAYLSAFRAIQRFEGTCQLSTWLHRIVVNACLDRLRRDKPTSELPEYELSDKRDAEGSVDTRLDVREALERLPEGQRMALILVDMHGLSVAEAAAVLEVAEGTVKSRCSRGRDAMAALLREPSEQP